MQDRIAARLGKNADCSEARQEMRIAARLGKMRIAARLGKMRIAARLGKRIAERLGKMQD